VGRGGVDYEYSIGRFEVTTAQWVEFFNAALDRPADDRIPFLQSPQFWGGTQTSPVNAGGQRFAVRAGGAMLPTGDITWRTAAIYCNWLHNGKATNREAFLNGAYDVTTFGYVGNIFQDQLTHHPDARYWIPTWDEWLKAAHYDPAKDNGDGTIGGWWVYSNATDTPLIGGPPGAGQANFGFASGAFSIPLGAYPDTRSPWGLLDMAGATGEWTEGFTTGSFGLRLRIQEGSHWFDGFGISDSLYSVGADEFPHIPGWAGGLRVASSVPVPSGILGAGVLFILACRRRER
ncbi:MAG: SUMF1/EgtB/PvdO family nonheme iron enzyme, partial [Phycisphaerales bacterium]